MLFVCLVLCVWGVTGRSQHLVPHASLAAHHRAILEEETTEAQKVHEITVGHETPGCQCISECWWSWKTNGKNWCYVEDTCPFKHKHFGKWMRYCDAKKDEFPCSQFWNKQFFELFENLKDIGMHLRGGKVKKRLFPPRRSKDILLKDIRLYHPIRGPGERAPTIEKLDARVQQLKDAVENGVLTIDGAGQVTQHTESGQDVTYESIQDVMWDHTSLNMMKSKDFPFAIEVLHDSLPARGCSSDIPRGKCGQVLPPRQYLLLNGQGRVQAIKEAYAEFPQLKIRMDVYYVKNNHCVVANKQRDQYIDSGLMLSEYKLTLLTCEDPITFAKGICDNAREHWVVHSYNKLSNLIEQGVMGQVDKKLRLVTLATDALSDKRDVCWAQEGATEKLKCLCALTKSTPSLQRPSSARDGSQRTLWEAATPDRLPGLAIQLSEFEENPQRLLCKDGKRLVDLDGAVVLSKDLDFGDSLTQNDLLSLDQPATLKAANMQIRG